MANRIDKIKKQIEARRKEVKGRKVGKVNRRPDSAPFIYSRHEEARDEPDFYVFNDSYKDESSSRKWKVKDTILMKSLISITLFLVIAIMFNSSMAHLEGAKQFVKGSFEREFQFAAVANWYENQFGRPLALLPLSNEVALENLDETPPVAYAVPATGFIREDFQQNGKGVLVETNVDSHVEAVKTGLVVFVGVEEGLGKTVAIEHYDGGQSWYGMLDTVEVKLYDPIQAGELVGTVSASEEAGKGIYYFALKEGEDYIDPNEVISFD